MCFLSCNMLPVKETVKGIYKFDDQEFYFKVVELKPGATSQDYTTVLRVYSDSTCEVAHILDRIGDIKVFSLKADTITMVIKYFEWQDSIYTDTSQFYIKKCIDKCK